jgi:hypothetical protein
MSQILFSKKDLKFIEEKKIPIAQIQAQINYFRKGFPPIFLIEAATSSRGLRILSETESKHYAELYDRSVKDLQVIKFVPASGAASRMFKHLFEFVNDPESIDLDSEKYSEVIEFIEGLDKLALKSDLQSVMIKRGEDLKNMISEDKYRDIVEAVLMEDGLNYGQLPKGLLSFHRYEKEDRTPVEEHLVEAAAYCRNEEGKAMLHFTVSDEHLDGFIDLLSRKQSSYEERLGVTFQIDFSIQRSFTDTIAVDLDNNPFRDENGALLFRPGGHGALLANLNELNADLIFIKNIDNIAPDRLKPTTFLYKKALAGILLECQEQIFSLLRQLHKGADKALLYEAEQLLGNVLNLHPPIDFHEKMSEDEKLDYLRSKLNRPVRVCGMVKNEGEPGGGPFWSRNPDGSVSLQVVEGSQIDFNDHEQAEIVKYSSHFNPVDLVCGTRDYKGNPFDLQNFTDPDTGFISIKSLDGRSLKAQELPGLWNGAMGDWNTVFVEVPIETFNPVKTINDLLRSQHLT